MLFELVAGLVISSLKYCSQLVSTHKTYYYNYSTPLGVFNPLLADGFSQEYPQASRTRLCILT